MNDMELYSAIEAVVNFDLESDPDMIAAESAIETVEYALESAQMEYELTGDERFETVIEASLKKKILSEDNWFGKLVATIKKFIRNAMASIRAMLNKLANKVRLMKAKSMQKTVKAASKSKLTHEVKISESLKFYLDKMNYVIDKDMKNAITMLIDESIELARTKGTIEKADVQKLSKVQPQLIDKKSLPKKGSVTIDLKGCKTYLDKAVKALTGLDKSFPSAKQVINKNKATHGEKGYIRTAVNYVYNLYTGLVKQYYTAAMQVCRVATAGGSGGEVKTQLKGYKAQTPAPAPSTEPEPAAAS